MFESEVKNMKNDEKVTNINAVQWQIDNYFKTTVVFFKKKVFPLIITLQFLAN